MRNIIICSIGKLELENFHVYNVFFSSFFLALLTDVYAHNILQFSDHFYLLLNTFYINNQQID